MAVELEGEFKNVFGDISGKSSVNSEQIHFEDVLQLLNDNQQSTLANLSIKGVVALDADISYDSKQEPSLVYFGSMSLFDIALNYSDIPGELTFSKALFDFKTDNVRFTLEDGYFDKQPVKGHMTVSDFANPLINGAFDGMLDIAYIRPFLTDTMTQALSGMAELSIKLYGHPLEYKNLNVTGSAKLSNGHYETKLFPEPVDSINFDLYFDRDMTIINKLSAMSKSVRLSCDGRVSDLLPYLLADSSTEMPAVPGFEMNLNGEVDLGLIPQMIVDYKENKIGGNCSLQLNVRGDINHLSETRPRGKLTLDKVSYTDKDLSEPITSGKLILLILPDTMRIQEASLHFVSSDISLTD